jgi:4-hydroxybenzoate polyprenyltransferase
MLTGFISVTLIASSNYVINELLDAPFDRLHPVKKSRPAANGLILPGLAYAQWLLMMAAGLALALGVSYQFAAAAAALWLMGCLYNIPPVRLKDRVYLDVLSESVNNPLRMLLGWYMVPSALVPPLSLLGCYWMFGCYLMALKRFSEYREIQDAELAGSYRKSFQAYSELSLLTSAIFYAAVSMMCFGAFIARYRIEWILCFPSIAFLMAIYFKMAFQSHSAAQHPEKLYREKSLMFHLVLTVTLLVVLLLVDIPVLDQIFPLTLPVRSLSR